MSLRPLLDGSADSVREAAISFWGNAVSVRTANHRLVARKKKGAYSNIELYDLRETPDPLQNIAASEPALVKDLLSEIPKP